MLFPDIPYFRERFVLVINYGAVNPPYSQNALFNQIILIVRASFHSYGGGVLYMLCVRPLGSHVTELNLIRADQGRNPLIQAKTLICHIAMGLAS